MFFWKMKHYWSSNGYKVLGFGVQLRQGTKFYCDNSKQVPSFRKINSPAISVKAVRKM